MRNYVIINGVNSLTIQGLAIKTLPPITKPIQRNLREEIDGRDGDIVTTLGYGAYDKTIEIGLFGTFDIDEVIAFFNQKGTITFSNELDKVYNFQALEQVDYAELLKFRTANVILHCQPFKYPVTETPLEEEYEYVTGTGTNITLDNTSEAIFNKIDLLGNTEQTQYTGINQLGIKDKAQTTSNGLTYKVENGVMILNGTTTSAVNLSLPTEEYSITQGTHNCFCSRTGTSRFDVYLRDTNNVSKVTLGNVFQQAGISNRNFTAGETFTLGYTTIYIPNGTTFSNEEIRLMITNSATQTYEPYVGGIPAPNPDYPQDVHVVSGDNTIDICGKNLVDIADRNVTYQYIVENVDTKNISGNVTLSLDFVNSSSINGVIRLREQGSSTNLKSLTLEANQSGKRSTSLDVTPYNAISITFQGTSSGYNYSISNVMLEKSSTATTYEPYIGSSYPISLGSIELCKIGDYQDYIYKEGKKWYKYKAIGKVVLDGTESWSRYGAFGNAYLFYVDNVADGKTIVEGRTIGFGLSNYFTWALTSANTEIPPYIRFQHNNGKRFYMGFENNMTLEQFKTWLSTHNTIVYYVLATPTNTLIEDTTLIEQLETLRNAQSYKGQTNISQTNNDMPFILDLSALKENSDHLVIDNIGNIYSKPTLDLEGTGIVDIYLNDTQMFEVDLSEKNEIVIDTEKMEAYNPTDNTLANRQVTGDYSKFKLDSGENDLRFSGDLTKATITRYERWL